MANRPYRTQDTEKQNPEEPNVGNLKNFLTFRNWVSTFLVPTSVAVDRPTEFPFDFQPSPTVFDILEVRIL